MTSSFAAQTPLALHACCGPCSLKPVDLLREAGFEPHIFFCNPNIAPDDEYDRRLNTLLTWAKSVDVPVEEVPVDRALWEERVGEPYAQARAEGVDEAEARAARCRACYRLRFEATARAAATASFKSLSTTLSVSPYQYTEVIEEELARAAEARDLEAHFEDFRPYYREATRQARELGLYRQNYCGCALSAAEAAASRAAAREAREREKALREAAARPRREAERRERQKRNAERRAYEQKRAHQRDVLRALRGL